MTSPDPMGEVREAVEEWRPLASVDGNYSASSLGRIRNNAGSELATRKDRYGYRRIGLRRDGKFVLRTVSSLVAEAFIGPRPKGLHVAHLNGLRDDDRAANLAYVTPRENMAHKAIHGSSQTGERHGVHKLTLNEAREILLSPLPKKQLARLYRVDPATIRRVKQGKNWQAALREGALR